MQRYVPQIATQYPILAGALVAGMVAAASCQASKRLPAGSLAGGGIIGIGAALEWFRTNFPGSVTDLLAGAVDSALAAAEDMLRALGMDLIANAMAQARSLFNDLQQWADETLGGAGRTILGLILVYWVYSRFFLRR